MGEAKNILVKPISSNDANKLCKTWHYSGKVVPNSQLHLGVFYNDNCQGVMQFGPSMRKDLTIRLVADTKWNGFIELNRMAFSDVLPKNSESRAIAIALKIIKKQYPQIEWVVSFADATQCGDGAIYRASGFYLTDIKKNKNLRINPRDGKPLQLMAAFHKGWASEFNNWEAITGYQLRYIYFLNKDAKKRLTVPTIPFSKIKEMGVSMYKGMRIEHESNATSNHDVEGGAIPTYALQQTRLE